MRTPQWRRRRGVAHRCSTAQNIYVERNASVVTVDWPRFTRLLPLLEAAPAEAQGGPPPYHAPIPSAQLHRTHTMCGPASAGSRSELVSESPMPTPPRVSDAASRSAQTGDAPAARRSCSLRSAAKTSLGERGERRRRGPGARESHRVRGAFVDVDAASLAGSATTVADSISSRAPLGSLRWVGSRAFPASRTRLRRRLTIRVAFCSALHMPVQGKGLALEDMACCRCLEAREHSWDQLSDARAVPNASQALRWAPSRTNAHGRVCHHTRAETSGEKLART
jgi:hypothetical protein